MDEMIPANKRGQPVRKCAKCPKYELDKLWCPIRAETRQPAAPACRYGVGLIVTAEQKEYQDAKTSS